MAKTKAEIDKRYEERHKEERKEKYLVWGTSIPKFPIGIAVKGKALFSAGICREEGKYSSLTKKNEKFWKNCFQTLDRTSGIWYYK